ncbi:MAG TPA: sigma 54-interacting transcriptional regulator [Candidatus Thiothrix moscowensis]|uniref:sigma-54 interaction domain-containing protein n=1 Tax=unclassified Thiothrix TaxID=2636184 RepID=UPI0025F0DE15|nr:MULTISPECIES: sigma 54-interacting transcriptional regulator [unclassified Thiothrix]HRJ52393.1 sigma 54-interacting transcriptional regulator [Candidatus Thiothrix moscowensis]HRJ92708.1 sigma 54-interacting transcriptional regulator [Candidatus Thiothrix moscowensis]
MTMQFDDILTRSPIMEAVLRSAHLIAQTDASVLITGESGTGKELVAHAMHAASPRRAKPFITVNCAALPESLAESLLFGHRKGAFTGADSHQAGLIGAADGGTLLLDEIGELPLNLQAKLLRFLESGEVLPLGDSRPKYLDVRVFAATHRDLYAMAQTGEFRLDLFYRLNIVPVELPPLRERREDIELLTKHFLHQFATQHRLPIAALDRDARVHLARYAWHGNVRELRNLCERLSILLAGREIALTNLPTDMRTPTHAASSTFNLPETGVNLEDLERDLLNQALERTGNNKTHAARLLGISRDALNYRLKKNLMA